MKDNTNYKYMESFVKYLADYPHTSSSLLEISRANDQWPGTFREKPVLKKTQLQ